MFKERTLLCLDSFQSKGTDFNHQISHFGNISAKWRRICTNSAVVQHPWKHQLTLICSSLQQRSTWESIFDLSNSFSKTMCHMGKSSLRFIEIAVNAFKIHSKPCYVSNVLFASPSSGLLAHISFSVLWTTCVENTVPQGK